VTESVRLPYCWLARNLSGILKAGFHSSLRDCGPVALMAAKGIVPKNWTDLAHMIGRWNDANDPAQNARGWFRDNPDQQALLDDLFQTGKVRNPLTGIETIFRRETLGLIGKNRRYVWLAQGITLDDARKLLP
jgi:hypothetical protein